MTKQQILIVDDEEINRLILDGMFEGKDMISLRLPTGRRPFIILKTATISY